MLNERFISLLSLLSQEKFQTADKLAKKLHSSSKTVRNCMKQLDNMVSDYGAHIEAKHGQGFKLIVNDLEKFNQLLTSDMEKIPDTSVERVQYLFEYFLNSRDYIKMEELSEDLCICKKTLTVDLKEVDRLLNRHDVLLERKPYHGMRIVGKEFNIRLCMAECMKRKKETPFVYIGRTDVGEFDEIAECILECIDLEEYRISYEGFQNLVIHIQIAVDRIKSAHCITMDRNESVKNFGNEEYLLAEKCARKIGKLLNVTFPQSEIYYISIHLAGKRKGNKQISEEITSLVKDMLEEIYKCFRIDFRADLELIMSLGQHLEPLEVRLKYGMGMKNPLLKEIKERYSLAYIMAIQSSKVIRYYWGKEVNADEAGYIALAIALALERRRNKIEKKTVLLVCSSGEGSTKLFAYKIQEHFQKYINKIITADLQSLEKMDFTEIDCIFTMVPILKPVPVPVCKLKFFLQDEDIEAVEKILKAEDMGNLLRYYPRELFFARQTFQSKEEVLRFLCEEVTKQREVEDDFYEEVMKREDLAPTAFGNKVAMPHPNTAMTKESFVSVCILEEAIDWGEEQKVRVIFLVAIQKDSPKDIQKFYRTTSRLLLWENGINKLIKNGNYDTFVELLRAAEQKNEQLGYIL